MINNPYIKKSEIINQKKNFIFNVEQTSTHVFPNEEYTYFIYIKNISGVDIEEFSIYIKHPKEVDFTEGPVDGIKKITLKNDEVKLYEMKAYCSTKGEHIVNFFGYGKETQVLFQSLKIKCTRTYNSDKLIHRISVYDFTPYEENYQLEADEYNEDVMQIFKNQKLPYKAGEQPFPMEGDLILNKNGEYERDPHFYTENKESQSFLDQYEEAKNSKEHVYQYISRENFIEDSVEQFTGENIEEIIDKINNNSSYFKGRFIGSGTNHLLNDFTQYEPNGFIYRMGLLSSEIYHLLGVIPTYSYMSDYLFRWAPHPSGQHLFFEEDGFKGDDSVLLDLYPKQQAMLWDKHIWAGTGWIVSRIPTEDYKKTDEYQTRFKEHDIILKEKLECFDDIELAEEYVRKQEKIDRDYLSEKGSDIIEYEYVIEESIYDTGVFFVNIPVNKIPKNFYVPTTEVLYPIIERVKPFGTKPIINYIIETKFNLNIKQKMTPNYYYPASFIHDNITMALDASQYQLKNVTKNCEGQTYSIVENTPIKRYSELPIFNQNISLDIDSSNLNMIFKDENGFNLKLEESVYGISGVKDIEIKTVSDIAKILYNNNYNNISFYIRQSPFYTLKTTSLTKTVIEEDDVYNLQIADNNEDIISFDGMKLSKPGIKSGFTLYDKFYNEYQLIAEYDDSNELTYIKYKTVGATKKEHLIKEGAIKSPDGIGFKFVKFNNKYLIIFFVEEKTALHYFTHTIVPNISEIKFFGSSNKILENIKYSHSTLSDKITLNTPVIYSCKRLQPSLVKKGDNWTNLYRLNDKESSYAYCSNMTQEGVIPDDILLYYDNIDVPETSILKQIRFKINGTGNKDNKIYLLSSINTNYITEECNGNILRKRPQKIEAYSEYNESTEYYKIHLKLAEQKNQTSYVKEITKLLNQNIIFNEDTNIEVNDYLKNPNDFISIRHPHWCELSDFEFPSYNLNNTKTISFVIEGYNENEEIPIVCQILSETNYASEKEDLIPSGYFYKKISLPYSNEYLLESIRTRFRFKNIIRNVNIFNTSLEVEFKNKEVQNIDFEFIDNQECTQKTLFEVSNEYYYPEDYNNGLALDLQFDELNPGTYYNLNTTELEVLYKETSIDFIANESYQNTPMGIFKSIITGKQNNAILRGEFYSDYQTISQIESNISSRNKGIRLQNEIYQSFVAKDDNITAVEIYPNGFVGQPDELLRIGLFTNHGNTPDELIKEVYANGWIKNNEELKEKFSIKYNISVNNLTPGETYWVRIKVEMPKENSYYRLKGIDETLPQYRLLSNENNNYINTLSCLTFNIYSRNIVKTFNHIPAMQELLDNPNILIGLHKGKGVINNLAVNKYNSTILGEDYMGNKFEQNITQSVDFIIKKGNSYYNIDGSKIEKPEEGDGND